MLVENFSVHLNFVDILDICSGFGTIERFQINPRTSSNSFYIRLHNADSANHCCEKSDNLKMVDHYLNVKLFNSKSVLDKDDDHVPELDLSSDIRK